MSFGFGERRANLRRSRLRDGEREDAVEEETAGGKAGDDQEHEPEQRSTQKVKLFPVESVSLEVEHGGPDPHGREDLDEREPPVREEELHSLEEHGEGADQHRQGCQPTAALAECQDGSLDHRFVPCANGRDQTPDLLAVSPLSVMGEVARRQPLPPSQGPAAAS